MPVDMPRSAELDQPDFFFFTRLEAHGSSGGDVEAQAISQRPIKMQRSVDLEEMIVAADLNRAISTILNDEGDRRTHRIQNDEAVVDEIFTWGQG